MTLLVSLGIDLTEIPKNIKRKFNKFLKPALFDIGKFWHKKIRPGHFARGASGKYGYDARNSKYLKAKEIKKGPRPDLIYSGKLNRFTKHAPRINSTTRMATVRMDVPPRRKKQKQINKELTTVNRIDNATMAKRLIQKLTKPLEKLMKGSK